MPDRFAPRLVQGGLVNDPGGSFLSTLAPFKSFMLNLVCKTVLR